MSYVCICIKAVYIPPGGHWKDSKKSVELYILAATATQSDDRHNMQRAFARICKVYVCDKEHQRLNTELVLLIKLPEKQGLRVFRPLYLDVERVKRLMS